MAKLGTVRSKRREVEGSSHLSEFANALEVSRVRSDVRFGSVHVVFRSVIVLLRILLELELQKLVVAWMHQLALLSVWDEGDVVQVSVGSIMG